MKNDNYLPQPPEGKHLPPLELYAHNQMLTDVSCEHGVINEVGLVSDPSGETFIPVQVSDAGYRFMPGPELSTTLYRGQHTKYEHCKPNLFRGENQSHGEYLYWYLKVLELSLIIQQHPGVFEVSNHWNIGDLQFEVNPVAIAQHYDFKTNMLDLTRSKDVAMFFATHKLNKNGEWVAALGHSAIIYRACFARLIKRGLVPVGIDPFPRPYAQKAFLIQLGAQDDFTRVPGVTCEEFIVTKDLAEQAWDSIGGADGLFPHDPFKQELSRIKDNKVIPTDIVKIALETGQITPDLNFRIIETHLNQAGFQVLDIPFSPLTESALMDAHQGWLDLRQEFTHKMRFRFASPHIKL